MRILLLFLLAIRLLAAAPATHPRLFWPDHDVARLQQRVREDPLASLLHTAAIRRAGTCLAERTVRYEIPDGKRLLTESRNAINRILHTAYAWRMTGDTRYFDRCVRELDAACSLKDWNPKHFLDVAEMAAAVAIGYDWLYQNLSEDQRRRCETALATHCLDAISSRSDGWWHGPTNNWSQVCAGGLLLAADVLRETRPDATKPLLVHSRDLIAKCGRFYQPEGAYPEGPDYWHYGTTYHVMAMALNERDAPLRLAPAWLATTHFMRHSTGPGGMPFNFADSGSGPAECSPALAWLATRSGDPQAITAVRDLLARRYGPAEKRPPDDRFLPLTLLWLPAPLSAPLIAPRHAAFQGEQALAFFRSDWTPDALWLGIKGGTPAASHGHMDCGAFVLDWAGTRWFHDLGRDDYNLPGYFGDRRFTYFRLQNLSHNTLVIDGKLQNPKANPCPLTPIITLGAAATTTIDLTDAYRGQCQAATRKVEFNAVDKRIMFTDHLSAPAGPVRWQVLTDSAVSLAGPVATLEKTHRRLTLTSEDPKLVWQISPVDPPDKSGRVNPNLCILWLQAPAIPDLTIKVKVAVRP